MSEPVTAEQFNELTTATSEDLAASVALASEVERLRELIRAVREASLVHIGDDEHVCAFCSRRLGGPHKDGCPYPALVAEAEKP